MIYGQMFNKIAKHPKSILQVESKSFYFITNFVERFELIGEAR